MIRAVSQVPVIVATARREEAVIVAVLESGADDYVVKPFGRRGRDNGRPRPASRQCHP